jgi:hypothetical protein
MRTTRVSGTRPTAQDPGSGNVTQTNIVSDQAGQAAMTDQHLLNAWGLAFNPSGPAWISANGNGTAQVYDSGGNLKLSVTIPPPAGGMPPAAPTGQIFNPLASSVRRRAVRPGQLRPPGRRRQG